MEKVNTPSGPVSVALDGPEKASATIVLGHGAGGGMNSEFMVTFAQGLAEGGLRVCRFNFPYVEQGRKSPDRQAVLEDAFRAIAHEIRSRRAKLVLGGKSLGGRIASYLAASGSECDGLVFLGYPLHPPGRPDRIRDAHLKDIRAPMLFVEGTRDPFCPLETLERVRKTIEAPTELKVIDDGDHSFKVRKSSGRTTKEAWREAIDAVTAWVGQL